MQHDPWNLSLLESHNKITHLIASFPTPVLQEAIYPNQCVDLPTAAHRLLHGTRAVGFDTARYSKAVDRELPSFSGST